MSSPTLYLLCGKIAAGKSTLAAALARDHHALLIVEDDWLDALFADEMQTLRDFARCSAKLRQIMGPHVISLLNAGNSVVLDFQANTVEARVWMKGILARTAAAHQLHHLDPPDATCLVRLHERNAGGGHPFSATQEQFRLVNRHIVPPSPDEGFTIIRHGDPQK